MQQYFDIIPSKYQCGFRKGYIQLAALSNYSDRKMV